jgi:hypothetical protein
MIIAAWSLHFAGSAILTIWAFLVVLRLAFKNHSLWTAFNQFEWAVIPATADAITMPGRLILERAEIHRDVVYWSMMLLNSLFWAFVLTKMYSIAVNWLIKRNLISNDRKPVE